MMFYYSYTLSELQQRLIIEINYFKINKLFHFMSVTGSYERKIKFDNI